MVIQALVKKSSVKSKTWHIKGHQDKIPYKILDTLGAPNVQVDLIAKAYWEETQSISLHQWQQRIQGEEWTIWIGNWNICLRFKGALYEYVHHPRILEMWEKCGIQPQDAEKVDWEANEVSIKNIPIYNRH